ncbi:hypothetical protein ig2599ANME_0261 [groundwater metagenome]
MSKDDADKLLGLLLGVVGGIALLEILKSISGRKCPSCGAKLGDNQNYCYRCGYFGRW